MGLLDIDLCLNQSRLLIQLTFFSKKVDGIGILIFRVCIPIQPMICVFKKMINEIGNRKWTSASLSSLLFTLFRENAAQAHKGSASLDLASKLRQAPIILRLFFSLITTLNPAESKASNNTST